MEDSRIPVTILTGYLGSGKTTLVNSIMKNTDRKIGVIVNEVGEIDIDGQLIEQNTSEVIKFSEKCMCCAVRGDIVNSVLDILNKYSPEAILIETSGLAHPVPIAMSLNEDEVCEKVRVDAIICVVDAENVFDVIQQDNMLVEQLESADMIILTKSDLVSNEKLEEVTLWLKRVKPETPVIQSEKGEIDNNVIFDLNSFNINEPESENEDHHHHSHFDTSSIVLNDSIKKKNFVKFLDKLSNNVYRSKGFIVLDKNQYSFHKVGYRWEINPIKLEKPESKLVFIGSDLSEIESLKKKYLS